MRCAFRSCQFSEVRLLRYSAASRDCVVVVCFYRSRLKRPGLLPKRQARLVPSPRTEKKFLRPIVARNVTAARAKVWQTQEPRESVLPRSHWPSSSSWYAIRQVRCHPFQQNRFPMLIWRAYTPTCNRFHPELPSKTRHPPGMSLTGRCFLRATAATNVTAAKDRERGIRLLRESGRRQSCFRSFYDTFGILLDRCRRTRIK